MNIPILGSLEAEPDIPEWLTSDPRGIPFFDGIKLPIVLDSLDEADEKEVESAIVAFLLLGPIDRLEASQHVFENYKRTHKNPQVSGEFVQPDIINDVGVAGGRENHGMALRALLLSRFSPARGFRAAD